MNQEMWQDEEWLVSGSGPAKRNQEASKEEKGKRPGPGHPEKNEKDYASAKHGGTNHDPSPSGRRPQPLEGIGNYEECMYPAPEEERFTNPEAPTSKSKKGSVSQDTRWS
jgi:hypothetical protein